MEYPESKNQLFRHLLFFPFRNGQKAAETAWDFCEAYAEGVIGEPTARKSFSKFMNGDIDRADW